MKKILAILFAVLMVAPFSVFASAATETVKLPEEPKIAADAPVYYVGFQGAGEKDENGKFINAGGNGLTPENYAPTRTGVDTFAEQVIWNKVDQGAKLVIEQKLYLDMDFTLETKKPVMITSLDPADNVMNMVLTNDEIDVGAAAPGQIGMMMLDCPTPVKFTIKSDLIVKDTAFLHRSTKNDATYCVDQGGKLVVDASVRFGKTVSCESAGYKIILEVKDGGYAFLHSVGFDAYTGNGTIVIGDEAIKGLDLSVFSEFEGKVVNAKGEVLEIPEPPVVEPPVTDPVDSTPATQKPDTPATQKADATSTPATTQVTDDTAENGNLIMIIAIAGAAVVVVAVVIVIIVKKKKD